MLRSTRPLFAAFELLELAVHASPPNASRETIFKRALAATVAAAEEAGREPGSDAEVIHAANMIVRLRELRDAPVE